MWNVRSRLPSRIVEGLWSRGVDQFDLEHALVCGDWSTRQTTLLQMMPSMYPRAGYYFMVPLEFPGLLTACSCRQCTLHSCLLAHSKLLPTSLSEKCWKLDKRNCKALKSYSPMQLLTLYSNEDSVIEKQMHLIILFNQLHHAHFPLRVSINNRNLTSPLHSISTQSLTHQHLITSQCSISISIQIPSFFL